MNPEIQKVAAAMKKANDDFKREAAPRLLKSDNLTDREQGANWAKAAADDTATMQEVSPGRGRRLDVNGKPYGPVLEENPVTGNYITESEIADEKARESRRGRGYARGGLVETMRGGTYYGNCVKGDFKK